MDKHFWSRFRNKVLLKWREPGDFAYFPFPKDWKIYLYSYVFTVLVLFPLMFLFTRFDRNKLLACLFVAIVSPVFVFFVEWVTRSFIEIREKTIVIRRFEGSRHLNSKKIRYADIRKFRIIKGGVLDTLHLNSKGKKKHRIQIPESISIKKLEEILKQKIK